MKMGSVGPPRAKPKVKTARRTAECSCMRFCRRRVTDEGFTLIEIMVALGMITVSMLALLAGLISSAKTQQKEQARANATRLATTEIERLRRMTLAAVQALEGTVTSHPVVQNKSYTQTRVVQRCSASDPASTCTTPMDTLSTVERVTVTVTWAAQTGTGSIKLATTISDRQTQLYTGNIFPSASPTASAAPTAAPTPTATPSASPATIVINSFTASPNPVANAAGGHPASNIVLTISASGLSASTLITVNYTDDNGPESAVTLSSSDGSTWTATVNSSNIKKVVPTGSTSTTLTFTAAVPGYAASPAATLTLTPPTVAAPAFTGNCTVSPNPISVNGSGKLNNNTTFTCTTSGLAYSDSIRMKYLDASGTAVTQGMSSTDGSTWTWTGGKNAAGFKQGSQVFTFVIVYQGADGASQTQTWTVS
jgi:type II secretory pathway pseudopilin PulG